MSIAHLIALLDASPLVLALVFTGIPLVAWLYGLPLSSFRAGAAPHRHVFSVLVFLACIPGAMSLVLTAYSLFLLKTDLLRVNVLVFFLPIFSMAATLILIRRKTDLTALPGFDRVSSLFVLLTVTFLLVVLAEKTRILLLFHGSVVGLLVFVAGLFLVLRWARGRLFTTRR